MKNERLFEALGRIDPRYIEEAAPRSRGRLRMLPPLAAAAACLVLIVAAVPFALRLQKPAAQTEPVKPAPVAQKSEPQAAGERKAGDELGMRRGLVLGGLYVGLDGAAAQVLLGAPTRTSNSGEITDENGVKRICWFYQTEPRKDQGADLVLYMVDSGSGWRIAGIAACGKCDRLLEEYQIGIGSTEEEVEAACGRDFERSEDGSATIYAFRANWGTVEIYLENGRVASISMMTVWATGGGYEELMEYAAARPRPGYDLSGDPTTAYRKTETGWQRYVLEGGAAKLVETALTIEDAQPLSEEAEPVLLLDFHNGTVAFFTAGDRGGAYALTDREAFEASLAGNETPRGVTLAQRCVFPAGARDTVEEALG